MLSSLPTISIITPPPQAPAQKSITGDSVEQGETASVSRLAEKSESLKDERGAVKRPEEARYSEEERRQIEVLKSRDREVRAHEAAHQAAAGGYARGGASYSYERGADGVNYAVGGEVSIDTATIANDPQATLQKAETIRAAALAPAQPSGQDISVAAQATRMMAQARAEMAAQAPDASTIEPVISKEISAYRASERGETKGQLWDGFA